MSTVYRLCAFLGWVELYRQDTTFLEPNDKLGRRAVDKTIFAVRSDLADGQLNTVHDWEHWRDMLIFREEQRAVGESMIVPGTGARTVMGYGQFYDLFKSSEPTSQGKWIRRATSFFLDPEKSKDFRHVRMKRLIVHLVDLIELLTPSRVREEHRAARARHAKTVEHTA
jgi:hypothetical protein